MLTLSVLQSAFKEVLTLLNYKHARFGALTSGNAEDSVFWDVTQSRRPISRRHIPRHLNLQFTETF